MQGWYTKFPEFKGRDFWISGESYGGHYVPNFAKYIVDHNSEASVSPVPLKGFLVGNAWTNAAIDNFGAAFDWWTHAVISDSTFASLQQACNFSNVGPLKESSAVLTELPGDACDAAQNQAFADMGTIDIYELYADVCPGAPPMNQAYRLLASLGRHGLSVTAGEDTPAGGAEDYEPCIEEFVFSYMNRPEVQAAIHANESLGYKWEDCSMIVNYSRSDLLTSMIPVYQYLMAQPNLRMLVFSGDVDAIVPVTGTRKWLASLDMPITEAWRPWTVNGQVGGYFTQYEHLAFTTVRGAGHMVPYTQPDRGFHMFKQWITGQPL
jgi:serine carboxypeptidase-like clade 2